MLSKKEERFLIFALILLTCILASIILFSMRVEEKSVFSNIAPLGKIERGIENNGQILCGNNETSVLISLAETERYKVFKTEDNQLKIAIVSRIDTSLSALLFIKTEEKPFSSIWDIESQCVLPSLEKKFISPKVPPKAEPSVNTSS